jgi:hypothetical protein
VSTVRLRYIGPIDQIDLPLVGKSLERGEEFDGPEVLLDQVGNYELASKPRKPAAKKPARQRAPRKAVRCTEGGGACRSPNSEHRKG